MIFEAITIVLLLTNAVTLVAWSRAKKKKSLQKTLTIDATELLSQLATGGAVVVTSVVDPSAIFQWSPKQ